VTFLTLVAVNRALRRAGHFAAGRAEPDLRTLLDLVALGTVADVVPLTGLNRAFVAQGMRIMARRTNAGLVALCDVAKIARKLDAWHLGWTLGPRVNAGGRIGRADLGARLLASDDPLDCARLAAMLDGHNEDRKAIEAAVLADAIAQVERAGGEDAVLLVAASGWHPGVIGIVAGRLKERYRRPACVVALEGGVGKASGRSVAGFDLGGAVIAARRAGLLMTGGGHPMAAGFTVAEDRLDALRAFFREHVHRAHLDGVLPHDTVPLLEVDGTLAAGGVTTELATLVGKLGPFGPASPEPRFVLPSMVVRHAKEVGQGGHVSVRVEGAGGAALRGIAFRAAGEPLGRALMDRAGAVLHLAGTLRLDEWAGRETLQLHIDDAAPAW
jgi:single-stranded-DNA-specific exonuclease